MNISRRTLVAALLALPIALDACNQEEPGRRIVVLIDQSGSIEPADRALYATSLTALAGGLSQGDRVLVAPIGDARAGQFRSLVDLTVRRSRKRLERQQFIDDARKQLAAAIPALLAPEQWAGAQHTRIVETIAAAAQVYQPGPRHGDLLILLSDGVEDSELLRLDSGPGEQQEHAALASARRQGQLPSLTGVAISVVGAGGPNPAQVERFWRAYAKATQASVVAYGRLPFRPDFDDQGGSDD
jgi:hypothetical protein